MKNNKLTVLAVALLIAVSSIIMFTATRNSNSPLSEKEKEKSYSTGDKDDPRARLEQEFKMLRDIKTNRLPDNILNLEQNFASKLPKATDRDNPNTLTWTERGPNNVR